MAEFFFHSFDIEPEIKDSNGKRRYLWKNYVKRENIDEEGHWRIEADLLLDLINAIDEQIKNFSNYTYDIALVNFTNVPSYCDGAWEAELNITSGGEE